jgi:N-acetylneuraminic acid mutarotase
MKNLFSTGFFLSLFVFSNAQYSIVQKASVPGTYRHHAAGFAINGMGYLGTGEDDLGNQLNDWWMYNPSSDTWTQKNNITMAARSYCGSFSIGSKGYITCGNTASSYLSSLWEYDPTTDAWTQKTSYPGSARRHPCMAVLNGEAYVGCGDGSTGDFNDFYKYNPSSNAWTAVPTFIGTARHHPVAVALNGKLYVGTGHTSSTNTKGKDFYVFDPNTSSWTQIANIPGIGRIAPFGFVLNGSMVVGWGADEGTTNYNDYFRYNESSNTWTTYTYTTNVCEFASVFFVINGKGYVGSGTYAGNCVNEFYEFTDLSGTAVNESANTSAEVSVYPNPVKESATVVVNGIDLHNSHNEFQLYDASGNKVRSQKISSSQINFERGDLSSGIYFYKVGETSSVLASGKLVIE